MLPMSWGPEKTNGGGGEWWGCDRRSANQGGYICRNRWMKSRKCQWGAERQAQNVSKWAMYGTI
eukprot:scaffold239945_cov19-Prasinocladus_malaysianus.AAC.1